MPKILNEKRYQAVLAVLAGRPWTEVTAEYRISRGRLAILRTRALEAIASAVADRAPSRPPWNRTRPEVEGHVTRAARRYPTWPARKIAARSDTHVRTVQRIRRRAGLPKLTKRPAPRGWRRVVPTYVRRLLVALRRRQPFLGPQRLSWELANLHGERVSASWIRAWLRPAVVVAPPARPVWRRYERHHTHSLWHGDFMEKVYEADGRWACQLTLLDDHSRTYVFAGIFFEKSAEVVLHGLIAAMREYRAIPRAVLFDNDSSFRDARVRAFCQGLGIRIIHSRPRHPQTNGKIERAFWDDWREFYWPRLGCSVEALRMSLPDYLHYRNHVRGHAATGGKPAASRLLDVRPSDHLEILDHLESRYLDPLPERIMKRPGDVGALVIRRGRQEPHAGHRRRLQ